MDGGRTSGRICICSRNRDRDRSFSGLLFLQPPLCLRQLFAAPLFQPGFALIVSTSVASLQLLLGHGDRQKEL